jgi:hypothetical protein
MATKSTRLKRYLVTTRRALVTKVFMSHFRIKILNLFEPSTTLVRIIFNLHLINSTLWNLRYETELVWWRHIMRQSWYDDCFIAETTTWLVIEKFVWRTKRKAFLSVNAPTYGWHIIISFIRPKLSYMDCYYSHVQEVIITYGKSNQINLQHLHKHCYDQKSEFNLS